MNVLNIISTTLTKQHSTYFQPRKTESRSPRSLLSTVNQINARQFNSMNLSILIDEIRSNLDAPDWAVVGRLSNNLFNSVNASGNGSSSMLFAALALKEWLMVHGNAEESKHKRQDLLTLARGHLEIWLMKGVAAEMYHLRRANELYLVYFRDYPSSVNVRDQVDHCKVLLFLGEGQEAADIITSVVANNQTDPQIANYSFYAGVIFKSLGMYDRANDYFFEATDNGPPRYFSQIEMMTIISRNLEEMNAEGEGEDNEDAYRMIHTHLLMEGLIPTEMDYDDWICDANTWLALGDKCAMHHMFSLATDFYGLGIMKDHDAFRKPMLWLRFAKACKRCGRKADALLAVKQALSKAPYNAQLNRAYKYCTESETFHFSDIVAGDLSQVLDLIPHQEGNGEVVVSKLQAIAKGALVRTGLLLGVGAQKVNARPMTARLGLVLQGRPVLLKVQASWMGKVTHIKVFDVISGLASKAPLRTPFAPARETGAPRRLVLTMTLAPVFSHNSSQQSLGNVEATGCVELILKFTDRDSGVYSYRWMRLKLLNKPEEMNKMPKHVGKEIVIPPHSLESWGSLVSRPLEIKVENLNMQEHKSLLDLQSQPSLYRTLLRESSLLESVAPRGVPSSRPESQFASTVTFASAATPVLAVQSVASGAGNVEENGEESLHEFNPDQYSSLGGYEEMLDLTAVSVTNAVTVELVKEGFRWRERYYLVRVVNEHDVTQVTFMQLHTDRIFVFLMAREHIDRSFSLSKRWAYLMQILESNPATSFLLDNSAPPNVLLTENFSLAIGPSELFSNADDAEVTESLSGPERVPNPLQMSENDLRRATEALDKPQNIMGKYVYTSLLPRGNGVSVILVDPQNQPIIGSGLEVVDAMAEAPASLSLLRDSVSHKFRDGSSADVGIDIDEGEGDELEGFSQLEYGSAVQPDASGLDMLEGGKRMSGASGDESAYELLGSAAALPVSGGDSYAMSPEEYEAMVRSNSRNMLSLKTDSDMEGLRYGGALDDDSVSQILLGSPEGHFPFFDGGSPKVNTAELSPGKLSAEDADVDQVVQDGDDRAIPSGQTMQDDALAAFEDTLQYITKIAEHDGTEALQGFALAPPAAAPPVLAPSVENRLVAARKSISLGMNLGAALTAALTVGKMKSNAAAGPPRRHSSAQQTTVSRPSIRKSTVSKFAVGTPAYSALVSVKAAAVILTSVAIGTALAAASVGVVAAVPPPPLVTSASMLDSTLLAIREDEEESQESEDDWIAQLFRESFAADDAAEEGNEVVDLEKLAAEIESGALVPLDPPSEAVEYTEEVPVSPSRLLRSRTRTGSDMYSDMYESSDEEFGGPVPLDQVDIEWIVELGSDGAMENFEEKLLEELFNQAVTQMSEIYSDQIPGIRDPLVETVLADAVDSVTDFVLYSEELCAQELEKAIQVEAVSVALLQLVEAHAVKNATRTIRAAEKAKVMAARKAIHDERVRLAAAKAAEIEAKAAADFAELKRFPATVVGESSAEASMRSGYFVKKIRSHIYGTEESEQAPVLVQSKSLLDGGPSAVSTRPHTVGSRRMSALRDTFTPQLPQSLVDQQQPVRPYTHHQQFTATHGGIVQHFSESQTPREPSALIARAHEDETGDVFLDESGVPLHIGDHSYDDSHQAWEGNDFSLNNYFQLEESQQLASPVKTRIGMPGRVASAPLQRSAGEISQHNRQVLQSRRAQNRGKPVDGLAPMWLTLGGAESASLLLPGAESSAVLNYTGGLGSTSMVSTADMHAAGVPLPLPMHKDEFQVPIVSSLYSRAQSPAMPAAALPSYAFNSADGLKQALQQNWDARTIPKYWNTALKARADERINEPFSVKSATARKQRRAIKTKANFAAAAAASVVNSSAQTREEVDLQFTSLMEDNEHVHESFFESHVGPFGSVDVPFVNYLRRSESQNGRVGWNSSNSQVLSQQPSQPLARPSTAPAANNQAPSDYAAYGLVGANSYVTKIQPPSYSTKTHSQPRATTAGSLKVEDSQFVFVEPPTDTSLANHTPAQNPVIPTHKFYKGLHHDHEYDSSHLLANQIEPPFHHISTRIACRSPPDVALHFKRSTAAIAEEIDEAVEREEVDEVFRKSLEIFHKIGYVQKLPLPHATHWVKVVAKYLMSLKSVNELRKRLATLQRAAPRSLTTEECICVLADVNGVVGQAVEKLKHLEYYAEIRLVSRSIHVKNMVHLLEGGEDVYKFKVGENRPRTASQEQFSASWVASENAFAHTPKGHLGPSTTPGGAMFAGMDEDMLRAATLVVDPYDASMVAQHPEVVAHRKIREQYDELAGATMASTTADGLPPRAQSAKLGGSERSVGFQGMQSTKSHRSTRASLISTTSSQPGSLGNFGSSSERVTAEKEIATLGKFLPAVQQLNLSQNSPYVRSRASMVMLSGNNDTPTVKEDESQSLDASSEEHIREKSPNNMRMSVSSPQRVTPGNDAAVAGGRNRSSLRLSVSSPKKRPTGSVRLGSMNANSFMLGAIAAAVAAVEEQEEGGEAVMGALSPTARTPSRRRTAGGSISATGVSTGSFRADSNTVRSSIKVSAAQAQRAWRQKSGIFDAAAFSAAVSEANSASNSRDGSPTNARRSPKHSTSPKINPSPRNSSPTAKPSRTPTFRKISTQSVSFDFNDYGSSNEPTARISDQNQAEESEIVLREDDEAAAEEEEEEEGEEEEEREQDASPTNDLFFDNVRPSKHISMNPWYLKNQKQQAPYVPVTTHSPMPTANTLLPSPILTQAQPASQLPPPRLIPPMLMKQRSYRAETIVGDIFDQEGVGVPFAVMSRRDASRAAQDEVLARSHKNHIRRSVEMRAASFQHIEKL